MKNIWDFSLYQFKINDQIYDIKWDNFQKFPFDTSNSQILDYLKKQLPKSIKESIIIKQRVFKIFRLPKYKFIIGMNDNIKDETNINFYYSLKRYRPICYSGKGIPNFLLLKQHAIDSLPCIVFINILFALVIVMEIINTAKNEFNNMAKNVNLLAVIFIDTFYALTIFMNPGIIAKEDTKLQEEELYRFCKRCKRETTSEMTHCIQCETCVEDLDHHCGFFGKCIAGRQRFAFYGFITFMFIGFICLLGSLAVLLNPQ